MSARHFYLDLAMTKMRPAVEGQGLCFHWSCALVMDIPGSDLIVADIRSEDRRFIHAWVEHRGKVYAPTLVSEQGGLFPIERDLYYQANDARQLSRLPYRVIKPLMESFGYIGVLRSNRWWKGPMSSGKGFAEHILALTEIKAQNDGKGGIVPVNEQ